jgi:hypothetical protein
MYTKLTAAQTHFRKLNLGAQGAPKGSMALFFFEKNYQKSARGTVSLSTTTTTTDDDVFYLFLQKLYYCTL